MRHDSRRTASPRQHPVVLEGQCWPWLPHFLLLLKHVYCLGVWVTGSIFLQGEVRLVQLTEGILVHVELDLFSGRVNPAWRLSPDESQEFLHLFQSLPRVSAGAIREGLGYRGMIVTVPGGTVAGFDTVRCSAGICVGQRPDGEQRFLDRDRALERWLLRTSQGRIDEAIRTAVGQELDPKN
jgi:hypothetical protein